MKADAIVYDVNMALDSLTNLIQNDIVAGELPLALIQENYRTTIVSSNVGAGGSIFIDIPLTPVEEYSSSNNTDTDTDTYRHKHRQPRTRIDTCPCATTTDNIKVSSNAKRNKLYNFEKQRSRGNFSISRNEINNLTTICNTTLSSNILKTKLKCGGQNSVTDQMVYFTLPNNEKQIYGYINPNEIEEKIRTKCHKRRPCQKYRT